MAEKKAYSNTCHTGHRQRMKERYLTSGLDGFSSHEIMEMLLFYALPYRDTNELGHRLVDNFGGFTNLMEADYADLIRVPGVTPHIATLIRLCSDIGQRYQRELSGRVTQLHDLDSLIAYTKPWFLGRREESVVLISLDNKRKLLNATRIFQGSVDSAQFSTRLAVQQALRDNATAVVIAHNHPNGFAFPSRSDLEVTQSFADILRPLEIRLLDHLIVAENDCLSMAHIPETAYLFQPGRNEAAAP